MELALLERIAHLGNMATTKDLHEVFKLQAVSTEPWGNRTERAWLDALRFALIYMAKPERGWISRPFGDLDQSDNDKEGHSEWLTENRPGQSSSQVWMLEAAGRHHMRKLRQLGVVTTVDDTPTLTAPYDPGAFRQTIIEMAQEVLNGRYTGG
jgi:hypothetical protein